MMKTELHEIEPNKVALQIEVGKEKVQAAYTQFFLRAANSVSIPGFRRGKIPRPVLVQHIGADAIRDQIEEELIQEAWPQAVRETKIHPVSNVKVEEASLREGEAFRFKVVVEVRPTLPEFGYTSRSALVKRAQVDEDAVKKVLDNLAGQFSKTQPLENGSLEHGDYFLANIHVSFEGTKDEELSEEKAYRKMTPEAQILAPMLGMKIGENRTFKHKVEAEADKESRYFGKELDYSVTLERISRPQLPAINDEFAKQVGDYASLEELKAKIREDLEERTRTDAEERAVDAVLDQISRETSFHVPEAMIQRTIDFFIQSIERRWKQYGTSLSDYLKQSNKGMQEYRESFREKALHQTRIMLIIDTIAEREKIEVSDAEYRAEVEERAQEYGWPVEKMLSLLSQNNGRENIEYSLVSRKIRSFLLKNNQIQYDMVNEADLNKGGSHSDPDSHRH